MKYGGSGRSLSVRLKVTCSELSVDADSIQLWPTTSECTWLFWPVRLSVSTLRAVVGRRVVVDRVEVAREQRSGCVLIV